MRKSALLQFALILACVALTAFLYFAPKTNLTPVAPKNISVDFNYMLEKAKSRLQRQEVTSLNAMEKILETKTGEERTSILDSLAGRWDIIREPGVAAGYYEKVADIHPSEKAWNDAAERYFTALRNQPDSLVHSWLVNQAINSYKKVMEINPENVDAKMNLAVCYTESSTPMNGIMILREIVQQHPDNIKAQMNLGLLSIRSGQYDKAIERFNKVLELNSSQSEAYYFLGYSYMNKGENAKAMESFNKYIKTGKDTQLLNEANVYLRQLNSDKPN